MADSLIHWFIADNYHETFWDISLCSTFTGSPTFLSKLLRYLPPRSTFTESPTFPRKLLGYLPRVQHSLNPRRSRASCWVISPAYIPNFGMYLCVQFVEIPQNHFGGSDTTECPAGPVLVGINVLAISYYIRIY